jgi:hypothetical protein
VLYCEKKAAVDEPSEKGSGVFMKKTQFIFIAGILTIVLILGGTAVCAAETAAIPTTAQVIVNGAEASFEAYNIGGGNFFKLRDIGAAVNFSVEWDSAGNRILIDTAKEYSSGPAASEPGAHSASGKDFTEKARIRYSEDTAYDLCRELENAIGIQIFYLPEWTEKPENLRPGLTIQHADFEGFDGWDSETKSKYFDMVNQELLTMQEAFGRYPVGFLKELAAQKSHKTEIVVCPPFTGGAAVSGIYVYDRGSTKPYVDIIYYTGVGDPWYYGHEMGHMVVEAAMIRNGWNESSTWWDNINANAGRIDFVSDYAAIGGRNEDCAETWAYLWIYPETVREACGRSSILRQKVQYLTDMLTKHYDSVQLDALPWRDILS